ncbi:diaminopimelate epimerase [Lysobacter niastensis]|uniref:Diaminopimelate epimerase n=1 Tax=Lysobacter niastensis TaxID=380629 RepID=A0ABS0B834_9GAMM|nr:diaminopimelate epimerase [Lysobacter niastensis]MBF6025183.1 diaminopimelate epimerase [Lysobacter niastensis]
MADPARTMGLSFTKMHGAGNDFVVIDLRDGRPAPDAALCRAIGDRHTGVGYDQLLTVEPPRTPGAVASYRIWNSDGSSSQQCGNGARCIAAWLVRDGAAEGDGLLLDSPAGTHAVTRLPDGYYRVVMGVPDFVPAHVPLRGVDAVEGEYVLAVDSTVVSFGAVSMGNPHAVIEVEDVASAPVATIGPLLQVQPAFPESVNVGFAQVESPGRVRLRVYERGAGETLACGSGACAAAAVMMRRGKVGRDVVIALPGGELRIEWPSDDAPLSMSGPTAFVFEGEWTA